jgi:hypothetical protein
MSNAILSDSILSSSAFSHTIDVPIEKVDIADWAVARQRDGCDHNRRETPLFAKRFAHKAKTRA